MPTATYAGKSTIGLRDVCYAMLTETADGFTYGDVKQVRGAIDVSISPNAEIVKQNADDGEYDSYAALGDIQISMELAAIPTEVQADWFGTTVDANGVMFKNKDSQGGYFALGFRALKSNSKFRNQWLYKVKAALPEEKAHTLEAGSVTFTTRPVTLTAAARAKDGEWEATLDEDDEGVNPSVVTTFLETVYEKVTTPTP